MIDPHLDRLPHSTDYLTCLKEGLFQSSPHLRLGSYLVDSLFPHVSALLSEQIVRIGECTDPRNAHNYPWKKSEVSYSISSIGEQDTFVGLVPPIYSVRQAM